jgi:hypothetical protein
LLLLGSVVAGVAGYVLLKQRLPLTDEDAVDIASTTVEATGRAATVQPEHG